MYTCPRCAGYGTVECPSCDGKGLIYRLPLQATNASHCSVCNGVGGIDCTNCGGRGDLTRIISYLVSGNEKEFKG